MRIYIMRTTTNDKWEIIEGVCVVNANNACQARKLVRENDEYCEEAITIVKSLPLAESASVKMGVVFIQSPVIE